MASSRLALSPSPAGTLGLLSQSGQRAASMGRSCFASNIRPQLWHFNTFGIACSHWMASLCTFFFRVGSAGRRYRLLDSRAAVRTCVANGTANCDTFFGERDCAASENMLGRRRPLQASGQAQSHTCRNPGGIGSWACEERTYCLPSPPHITPRCNPQPFEFGGICKSPAASFIPGERRQPIVGSPTNVQGSLQI